VLLAVSVAADSMRVRALQVLLAVSVAADTPSFLAVTPRGSKCQRHDETDSSTTQCQDWCKEASHCDFCKCGSAHAARRPARMHPAPPSLTPCLASASRAGRSCSMCRACTSEEAEDISYEGCQPWCKAREQCSYCKCRACDNCKACEPAEATDFDYPDCQPWCRSHLGHCAPRASLSSSIQFTFT
jgi:hypothetical protein